MLMSSSWSRQRPFVVVWPLPTSSTDDGGCVAVVVGRLMLLASAGQSVFRLTFRLRSSFPSSPARSSLFVVRRAVVRPSRLRVFPSFCWRVGQLEPLALCPPSLVVNCCRRLCVTTCCEGALHRSREAGSEGLGGSPSSHRPAQRPVSGKVRKVAGGGRCGR